MHGYVYHGYTHLRRIYTSTRYTHIRANIHAHNTQIKTDLSTQFLYLCTHKHTYTRNNCKNTLAHTCLHTHTNAHAESGICARNNTALKKK